MKIDFLLISPLLTVTVCGFQTTRPFLTPSTSHDIIYSTVLRDIEMIRSNAVMPFPDRQLGRVATRIFLAKKKKGFGKAKKSPEPKDVSSLPSSIETKVGIENASISTEEPVNAGQKALESLREVEKRKKEQELEKIREIRSIDEFVRDDPNAAVIPEKVAMRMGGRMLPFVGIPLFGGMGAFVGFWYFATYRDTEFQPALVAASTIGLLVVGLVGITYSVMSASWDPDVEGSGLGFSEFQTNVENLKSGLQRSRENAVTREKMAGLPKEEIDQALRALDRRDEKARMKNMTFEEKINNELK